MRVLEMSKKSVSYIKPQEPAFLARLKEQVGYKEGPTVDTKREVLPTYSSDESDGEDLPQIVVLKPGDLTAEEAAKAKKELEEAPADLNQRVLFKKPEKKGEEGKSASSASSASAPSSAEAVVKNPVESQKNKKRLLNNQKGSKQKQSKPVLSFEDEDEEIAEDD